MAHEHANSESLKALVAQLEAPQPALLIPEFQRDFVWETHQTYTLFDSLIRNIFIGSIIYGKPSFAMTLRRSDTRPRKGRGSRVRIERLHYDDAQITVASKVHGLKVILDGQQRVTSIYRALRGFDRVYFVARPDIEALEVRDHDLEALLHPDIGIQGEDHAQHICVPMHYAFQYVLDAPFDEEVQHYFDTQTRYGRALQAAGDQAASLSAFRAFRQLLPQFKTLFEEPRLLAYYLLDMSLEKFTLFFERSNSRGIILNFTDILAAKLFVGFNLRQSFEDLADAHPGLPVKREVLVRTVAVCAGVTKIEKTQILRALRAEDFQLHWEGVTRLYVRALSYLHEQRYLVSTRWLPSENLLTPLMMFFHALEQRGQQSLTQEQTRFIRWWYWAVVFSERYSSASNEKIEVDARYLRQVGLGEPLDASFFLRLRPVVDDPEQLLSYRSSSSVIYRGVMNLVHFAAEGLRDWTNDGLLSTRRFGDQDLHDHHLFPQGYLRRTAAQQDCAAELEEVRDSVVNRVLMPRDTNLRASDKPPFVYLQALQRINPQLRRSLTSHLVPEHLLDDETYGLQAYRVLWERAEHILELIRRETSEAEVQVRAANLAERGGAAD